MFELRLYVGLLVNGLGQSTHGADWRRARKTSTVWGAVMKPFAFAPTPASLPEVLTTGPAAELSNLTDPTVPTVRRTLVE